LYDGGGVMVTVGDGVGRLGTVVIFVKKFGRNRRRRIGKG